MATVTAIIPNFNHERFLERRIESVLQQSFGDVELILLDDASTDNSRQIMERYRNHPKVRHLIFNEFNSGSPFKQWQKGLQLVETDWVWIAESDDYCDSRFLESLLPAFSKAECVLAYSEVNWVDDHDQRLKPSNTFPSKWYNSKVFLLGHMLKEVYLVNSGMVVFRRACIASVGAGWESMKQAGDYWFWCEIIRQGRVYACGQPLAYFVRHQDTVSNQLLYTKKHWEEHLAVLDHLVKCRIITGRQRRKFFTDQLVGLDTIKKGLDKKEYICWNEFWHEQLLSRHYKISNWKISLMSYQKKIRHMLNS